MTKLSPAAPSIDSTGLVRLASEERLDSDLSDWGN